MSTAVEELNRLADLTVLLYRPKLSSGGDSASTLEAQGWRVWLTTLFPFAFDEEFSQDHIEYWDLRWSVLMRIREQQKLVKTGQVTPKQLEIRHDEYVTLLILGRGLAKSSSLEASAVMRGALLDSGYCLYVSEAQDQAEEHIGNCQGLINHEDSKLLEYYPRMAIVDDATVGGIKTKNRSDIFITSNGWICRAKGLNSKLRGLRIGVQRPDDIKLDDVDGVNDSIDVSMKKLRQITSSVLPTQARRWTTIDFGQNLILETGVMNQLYTGQSDALAVRQTIGITPTFVDFQYESRIDPVDGKTKHYIQDSSIPTWAGVDIAQAQKFLHDSGLMTFLAEYQNNFEKVKEGRVLANYNDELMVITEEMFARIFGSIRLLDTFNKYVMHDWSRTKSAYHACVAGKLAVSSQNTRLPGMLFLFDLMSFEAGKQADDIGLSLLESITTHVPDSKRTWRELVEDSLSRSDIERYVSKTDVSKWIDARRAALSSIIPPIVRPLTQRLRYKAFKGSHDQNNDALEVYRTVYGLDFLPSNPGESGGLEWANHYMQTDKRTRHPFLEDKQLNGGTWEKGCPGMFIIVKDSKYPYPMSPTSDSLHGSDLWRFQFNNWRMRPAKLTEAGLIEYGPMKMHDDCGQALQMALYGNDISAAVLTYQEKTRAIEPSLQDLDNKLLETKTLNPQDQMKFHVLEGLAKKKLGPQIQRAVDADYDWIDE
jgi:hypothetical protein